MEIQWIMFAKDIVINSDTTLSINGIYHHIDLSALRNKKVTLTLIAKVNPHIIETGEYKHIAIGIRDDKGNIIDIRQTDYKVRDIITILNMYPYLVLPLKDITFPYSGEYRFKVSVDKEYKNEESLSVTV